MLPERSIQIGQKLVEIGKIRNVKYDILSNLQLFQKIIKRTLTDDQSQNRQIPFHVKNSKGILYDFPKHV